MDRNTPAVIPHAARLSSRAAFVACTGDGVAPAQHSASFAGAEGRARIQPEAERTLAFAHWHRGDCMGETLLLLSCGAAFITGLVVAAVSLFS
jgi:hypothetical protein